MNEASIRRALMALTEDEIRDSLAEFLFDYWSNVEGEAPQSREVAAVADLYPLPTRNAARVFELLEQIQPGPGDLTNEQVKRVLERLFKFEQDRRAWGV